MTHSSIRSIGGRSLTIFSLLSFESLAKFSIVNNDYNNTLTINLTMASNTTTTTQHLHIIKVTYFINMDTLIFTEVRLESSLSFLFSADLFSLEVDGRVFFTFLPLLSTSSPSLLLLPSMSTTKQQYEQTTQHSKY